MKKTVFLLFACFFLRSVFLTAQTGSAETGKAVINASGTDQKALNTDMQKFSEEFLDGKNPFGTLEEGNKRISDKFKAAGAGTKDAQDPAETPKDLKFSEKETEKEVFSEIEVPDLNNRTADLKVENGKIELSYEKNSRLDLQGGAFGKKKKRKFFKTFPAPRKADTSSFRTKITGNKIIITFKKKKK